jgi:Cu+-exporting ATPase
VLFDKTGTLTLGKPRVASIRPEPGYSAEEVVALAAAAERDSEHPLAEAVRVYARDYGVRSRQATGFKAVPGYGVSAEVDSAVVLVGNDEFLGMMGVATNSLSSERTQTRLWVASGRSILGSITFADEIKPQAAQVIAELRRRGISVGIVSGDQVEVVNNVAEKLGIADRHGKLLPGDKAELIRGLQIRGEKVGMVGDGINDAPALARADVGFAIGSGAELAAAAGDITIIGGSPDGVIKAIDLSRATVRTIETNLFLAFIYNVIAIPIAAGVLYPWTGWLLDPMIAAGAMTLSSLSVVGNSLRLRRK